MKTCLICNYQSEDHEKSCLNCGATLPVSKTLQTSGPGTDPGLGFKPGAPRATVASVGSSPEAGWVLNPQARFKLTILGADHSDAMELKALLSQSQEVHPSGLYGSVAELVARTGLRCKEIDDYVARFAPAYFRGEELDIVPYCDQDSLFGAEDLGPPGRDLTTRFGFENLRFYCRQSPAARPVPESHRDRRRWEQLVSVGLAIAGPPMTKRGKTGDSFAITHPGGLPELHKLKPWIHHCRAVAELITRTYSSSLASAAHERENREDWAREITWGCRVTGVGDDSMCPFCARLDGREYALGQEPIPPFHIGCRCGLIEIFR
jgi:hypothetical protein